MRFPRPLMFLIAMVAAPVSAQLALPRLPVPAPAPGEVIEMARRTVQSNTEQAAILAERLRAERSARLERLVRRNRASIEFDSQGQPARRGELLIEDFDLARAEALGEAGFRVLGTDTIEGLDISVTRVAVPAGMALAEAEAALRGLLPGAVVTADTLHFPSGVAAWQGRSGAQDANREIPVAVGMIDGAPGSATATVTTKGFATGAPRVSDHGSAVASLLREQGAVRLRAADVYGSDPAGGNALAIAQGLGWLVASGSKVVTISLVGPANPLLAKAIVAAQRRGVVIVAAVGNDGPAAPPAYPASYPGVIAVTGVDGKGRALIEAGRASHLDYAAPGADIVAIDGKGRRKGVRGTSFAAPLVAARIAAAMNAGGSWRAALDREARDLGKPGADPVFGRGLVCASCARR